MKNSLVIVMMALVLSQCNMTEQKTSVKAPVAAKKAKVFKEHGQERVDDYFWLNQREDSAVLDYLNAENDYLGKRMAHTQALQTSLYDEMVARIKKDDASVPFFTEGYWYYTRYVEGGEYPIKCRKKETLDADEEIMLDGNEMAKGHDYFSIGSWNISPNNEWIVYGIDTVSRRKYTLYFKNLLTGKVLEESIPETNGSAVWADDNKTIFYATKDEETLRPDKVHRFQVGGNSKSTEVYFEKDDTFYTGVSKTRSGKYIVIWSGSTLTNDFQILESADPMGEFKSFSPRVKGHEYTLEHREGEFIITTNKDAINFKVMKTSDQATAMENWTDYIPHQKETLITGVTALKDYLVIEERTAGLTQIKVKDLQANEEFYIEFGEQAYAAGTYNNYDYKANSLRYFYESMTTPESVIDIDLKTKTKTVKKQKEVLGTFSPEDYKTERVFATARDGAKVPMSIVYKKDMKKDGSTPALLYGYGSYGATIEPYFSSSVLSLLDRGFVFAIAHIRGSQMMGREWYEDGKLLKKKNTFHDFIDCGKYLIKEGYAAKDQLYGEGGSAGGLLIGAVINMEPSLFNGVIAAVPFVDVMTTMLDETIPLTTAEYDEWGNPNEKEYYDYMLSYSPYDNVQAHAYPNMLVTTGLHDSQVQYFEPAKWVAKLRELKTDDNMLIMKTNMTAGHGGVSGRFERYKEKAMEYAFFLDLAGIKK